MTNTQNTVEMTPEQAATLAELAKKLQADGEVLIQTDEDAGSDTAAPDALPMSQRLN